MRSLIDTTEMYLKAIFELQEDGLTPRRVRIAERLGRRTPSVSQTVAKLRRDGLLLPHGDPLLEFAEAGRRRAVRVMRKHRLAEVLLFRVIGLDWAQVHEEACRWEHVMSDEAERRIAALCGYPRRCPHGNPIPGLGELGVPGGDAEPEAGLTAADVDEATEVFVSRISERVQDDVPFMREMQLAGIHPGSRLTVFPRGRRAFEARTSTRALLLDRHKAGALFVSARPPAPDPGPVLAHRHTRASGVTR